MMVVKKDKIIRRYGEDLWGKHILKGRSLRYFDLENIRLRLKEFKFIKGDLTSHVVKSERLTIAEILALRSKLGIEVSTLSRLTYYELKLSKVKLDSKLKNVNALYKKLLTQYEDSISNYYMSLVNKGIPARKVTKELKVYKVKYLRVLKLLYLNSLLLGEVLTKRSGYLKMRNQFLRKNSFTFIMFYLNLWLVLVYVQKLIRKDLKMIKLNSTWSLIKVLSTLVIKVKYLKYVRLNLMKVELNVIKSSNRGFLGILVQTDSRKMFINLTKPLRLCYFSSIWYKLMPKYEFCVELRYLRSIFITKLKCLRFVFNRLWCFSDDLYFKFKLDLRKKKDSSLVRLLQWNTQHGWKRQVQREYAHYNDKFSKARGSLNVRFSMRTKVRKFYGLSKMYEYKLLLRKLRLRKGIVKNNNFFTSFLSVFELRLATLVYRLNFANSIFASMRLVKDGSICVNGVVVKDTNYTLKKGDTISVVSLRKELLMVELYRRLRSKMVLGGVPRYVLVNYNNLTALVWDYPEVSDISYPTKLNLGLLLSDSKMLR